MQSKEERQQTKDLLTQLRREIVSVAGERVPKSILHLQRMLVSAQDPWDRFEIWRDIRDEYARLENWEKQLEAIRQASVELPEEPLPLVSLAEALMAAGRLKEAGDAIENACSKAGAKHRFVRYALSARARIAIALGDLSLFADSLRRLVEVGRKDPNEDDVDLETDFLKEPNDVAWNDEVRRLVDAYHELLE